MPVAYSWIALDRFSHKLFCTFDCGEEGITPELISP